MSSTIINLSNKAILLTKMSNKFGCVQQYLLRFASTQSQCKVLEHLANRSILHITGNETSDFLQGLITNDMKHLENGSANIYSLFLNNKGRVMYDTIVYKSQENGVYFVECDSRIAEALQRHLKMYRVRRKIDIELLDDKMKVWSVFNPDYTNDCDDTDLINKKQKLEGLIFPCGTLNHKASKFINNIMIYEDPRLSNLGYRILSESNIERDEIIKNLDSEVSDPKLSQSYKSFRYKIGLGEGIEDLPPGKPLPLEINCDYLRGVSFHKGCYIGQELTARTYHTGVVRKRLMPLIFEEVPTQNIEYDEKILDESGKAVGKFRGAEKKYGLALMRITEALKAKSLSLLGTNVRVSKPKWWPQEIQKETVSVDSRK